MSSRVGELFDEYLADTDKLDKDTNDAVQINPHDVKDDIQHQPSVLLHWGKLVVEAQYRYARQDAHINNDVWPAAQDEARRALETKGAKPTIAAIDIEAKATQSFKDADEYRKQLTWMVGILSKTETSLFERGRMLQSFNARQKNEIGSYGEDPDELEAAKAAYRDRRRKE